MLIVNDRGLVLKTPPEKLKGRVLAVEKTTEIQDHEGEKWVKCVFTLQLTRFSGRHSAQLVPQNLKDKEIRLVRYCLYDWHFKLGTEKTLEPEETAAVLAGKQTKTVYW